MAKRADFDFEITCKRFKNWVAKRPFPTFTDAALNLLFGFGTSIGLGVVGDDFIRGTCLVFSIPPTSPQSQFLSRCGGYRPLVESFLVKGALEKGHNFALMRACNTSISFVMKNIRGKEDLQTILVAGFGYGVVISLVTGVRGPSVMSVGASCAILNLGMHKAGIKMFPIPK